MSSYDSEDIPPPRHPRPLTRADSMPLRFQSPVAHEIDEFAVNTGSEQPIMIVREELRRRRGPNQSPTQEQGPTRYRQAYVEDESGGSEDDNRPAVYERQRSWSPSSNAASRPVRQRFVSPILVSGRPRRARSPQRRVTVDSDDLDVRVRRMPVSYPENDYEPPNEPPNEYSSHPAQMLPTAGYRSTGRPYYVDEDDVDVRVTRARATSPVGRLRHRPSYGDARSNYLSQPTTTRRHGTPGPVIINNTNYNEYEDDYVGPISHRYQSRILPEQSPNPIIINNPLYNDYDEDTRTPRRFDYATNLNPDVVSQAYKFSLSRHTNSIGSESPLGSVSDISEKEEPQEQRRSKKEYETGRTQHILRSRYVGDGVLGGRHTVELLTMPTRNQFATRVLPVFKWTHFEDLNMDFDRFQKNVQDTTAELPDLERAAISKILATVKVKYDKPFQTSRNLKTRFMVPSFIQHQAAGETRPKSLRPRVISWLCLPYFCLEKYFVPSNLPESSHPMRTILQARFSLTAKKRDMEQAVCQLPGTPADYCFYIAQVWFLVIDDSWLISCSRLSISSLQGEYIQFLNQPTENPPSPNIFVSHGMAILWSLPLIECQSWFAFISHFLEYWPHPFLILYNDKVITERDWPRILALAKKISIRLSILFRSTAKEPPKGILLEDPIAEEDPSKYAADPALSSQTTHPQVPSGPSLQVKGTNGLKTTSNGSNQANNDFHVFAPTNGGATTASGLKQPGVSINTVTLTADSPDIREDLKEIDEFLTNKTNLNDRLMYKKCPSRDRLELYKLVAKERKRLTEGTSIDRSQQKRYEAMVDTLNAAELLFKLFLPSDFQGPTVEKYWGALHQILENVTVSVYYPGKPQYRISRDCSDILDWLNLINRSTVPFRDLLCQASAAERSNIEIPEELPTAWLHLVLSLAFATEDMGVFDEQMAICNERLQQGMKKIVERLSENHLSEYVVFAPLDLAFLVFFQLSQKMNGPALDISETYIEYLKSLQSDIEANPLDRGHQDRVVSLKQEISVISETLSLQRTLFNKAANRLSSLALRPDPDIPQRFREHVTIVNNTYARDPYRDPPPYSSTQPPYLDPSGSEGLILQDCRGAVEKRSREFSEMQNIALDLAAWNIQKIDSNKDRQEAAIYAFTIVTIIFLPLSTVASILGMNTSDVRNMPFRQWVFWATALPLTALIIAVCLIWAGEVGNFWEGVRAIWGDRKKYVRVVAKRGERDREREIVEDGYVDRRRRSRGIGDEVRRQIMFDSFGDGESV
ncbi:hypothetical protein F5884DRAFT_762073 [Xylogone sp. PMI_703]|nr:hypothetical protein F5884DRAFT_762073 [Xylogone sp. PMI_703]